jgi:F0F1-type ATP synthase assembly protein I
MEPSKERDSAAGKTEPSEDGVTQIETTSVHLPQIGELPEPPVINYTRPVLKRIKYASKPDEHVGFSEAQNKANSVAKLGSGLSAGITFASSVIVSVLIGQWLDKHLEPMSSTPWATIIMLVIGFAAGFISFVRISNVGDQNTKGR